LTFPVVWNTFIDTNLGKRAFSRLRMLAKHFALFGLYLLLSGGTTALCRNAKSAARCKNVILTLRSGAIHEPVQEASSCNTESNVKVTVSKGFFESVFSRLLSAVISDPDVLSLVAKLSLGMFWVSLGLTALGTAGVDTKPFLSLISVCLVTFGFAAKEMLGSLFSGTLLILQRQIKRGDTITCLGFKGVVTEITSKYVRLRDLRDNRKKSEILLPSGLVGSSPIVVETSGKQL